ncbi:MAG: hypothetical protein U0610_31775 [bacterium]
MSTSEIPSIRLDLHERDIGSALCRACGGCCRITLRLRETTPRYRRFLRRVGYTLDPAPATGADDCCKERHPVTVDAGWCRHLEIGGDGAQPSYRCTIHDAHDYPELCAQFNCVSWAKANETYDARNALLVRAQRAWDRLRRETTPAA